jgi:hypothetical protein
MVADLQYIVTSSNCEIIFDEKKHPVREQVIW